jgi:tyrosine-specific transport protein
MMETRTNEIPLNKILPAAFLVASNVLGVGLLAMPIKLGLSGYLPSVIDILIVSAAMVVSALVIASCLPKDKKIFDLPSFFHQEMGIIGRWIAIICNLIILYGIIIAYLSGISRIIYELLPFYIPRSLIITGYFFLATSLVIFGQNMLRKSSTIVISGIWICFAVLIVTGAQHFNVSLLKYSNWTFVPLGLPVVISTFHFHNVIPTVSYGVEHNARALRKAIFIGVGIGLVMNLIWTTVVLGSLAHGNIYEAFVHGIPATIPMSFLLNSKVFTITGLVFAVLAITGSYMANGSGLFGFIRDLQYTYFNNENRALSGLIAFVPTLFIALIYPNIFLAALDIVGGIGEAMLFAVLPGLILVRMARTNKNKTQSLILQSIGYSVFAIGIFVMIFVGTEKLGITHLAPW